MKNDTASPWLVFHDHIGVVHSVFAEAGPELERLGLPDGKALFLLLAVESSSYPAEVARWLMLPKPTVTYLIKRAETAGHLTRKPDPDDRRRARLELTRRGRTAAERGRAVLDDIFGSRLAELTAAERRGFVAAVRAMSGGG